MSDEMKKTAGEAGAEASQDQTGAEAPQAKGPETAPADQTPEEQIADLRDKLLRAMAETENTRRRADKDKQEASKFGMTKFARELLSVADNFRRAIDALPDDEREAASEGVKNLITGVEMIEKELLAAFEKFGIRRIEDKGAKFDPNRHQAVAEIPGTGQPNGTVVEIYQVGYIIDDRLLRPAMVTVAKDANAPADNGNDSASPGDTINTTA